MAFHYDRIQKKRESENNVWTAYSDLFTSMAFLFLMLYVCVSLRSAAQGVQTRVQLAEVRQEAEDMREQMRAYDAVKKDYLEKGASAKEQEMYQRLMEKLTLLQDEATQEKVALEKRAAENADKAGALNQYQKIIRNIINANMVAQSDIKKREDIIQQKDSEIEDVSQQLSETSSQLKQTENSLAAKSAEAKALANRLSQARAAYLGEIDSLKMAHAKTQAREKQRFLASLEKEKLSAEARVAREREYSKRVESQSKQFSEKLTRLNQNLAENQREIDSLAQQKSRLEGDLKETRETLLRKSGEAESLSAKLRANEAGFVQKIAALKGEQERAQAAARAAFAEGLAKEKLGAEARIAREREFRKKLEGESAAYGKQLAELNANLAGTKRELAGVAAQKAELAAQASQLEGDLKRTQAVANYKRELAQHIRDSLARAGVGADVDPRTGDVTLSFGKEYFDTNEATLKPGMKAILEKFVPVYTRSLFADSKIAREIKNVELIGFASPTYKRRYVDPGSLRPGDQKAVNYNMDLSYQRAKSIFNYIFDTSRVRYDNQDRLLPLVKVTGRSYLASKKGKAAADGRAPTSMGADEFCRAYNCMESQKVIIKFNLEE